MSNDQTTEGQSVDEQIGTEAEAPATVTGESVEDATGAITTGESEEKSEESAEEAEAKAEDKSEETAQA